MPVLTIIPYVKGKRHVIKLNRKAIDFYNDALNVLNPKTDIELYGESPRVIFNSIYYIEFNVYILV